MKPYIKIAVVDDNHYLIQAVIEKLSFYETIELIFTAYSGEEALEFLKEDRTPDLILMDIEMPQMDGIQTTRIIKRQYPAIKVLILTVFDNDDHIFNAIQAGADGYLLKDTEHKDLYQAIQQTLDGGAVMTPSIALKTLTLFRGLIEFKDKVFVEEVRLSVREIEVLELVSRGQSYTVIAENLFLSPSTVRKHIENIYQKLQVHSKLEAVEQAKKRRLI